MTPRDHAADLLHDLYRRGVRVRLAPGGRLHVIGPFTDRDADDLRRLKPACVRLLAVVDSFDPATGGGLDKRRPSSDNTRLSPSNVVRRNP